MKKKLQKIKLKKIEKLGTWYKRPVSMPMPSVYVSKKGEVALLYWLESYK